MPKVDYGQLVERNILKDIGESEKILMYLHSITVGSTLWIPVLLEKDGSHGRKKVQKMMYTVVGKTKRMLICEKKNGIRECFTFNDLLTLVKNYGGLNDGKS